MTRHRLLVAAAAVACALGVTAAVQASIPDAAGVIHGCYTKPTSGGLPGNLRVIDTALGQTCQIGENSIDWSHSGPPGPQGPRGPQGPAGPKGDKGDPGANAYFAGTGLNLSGGNTFNIQGSYRLPQGCGTNQAPYQTAVPNAWGCFTAANAGESCSSGKFAKGIDANGDITCATPAPADNSLASAVDEGVGRTGLPDDSSDVYLASLDLSPGTYLAITTGNIYSNENVSGLGQVLCFFNGASEEFGKDLLNDSTHVPFSMADIVTVGGSVTGVALDCLAVSGADSIEADGRIVAVKID